jgi:hypothetical protein
MARRESRIELAAFLRQPLHPVEAHALAALLAGTQPSPAPDHPLFARAGAAGVLIGDSLDHDTQGSRLVREADARPMLLVSASLPAEPGLLGDSLGWLGGLLAAEPGDVLGFVVPPDCHRHDLRLLVWSAGRLVRLGRVPEAAPSLFLQGSADCTPAGFCRAAGLPQPDAAPAFLLPAMRRVALALAERQALPVAQRLLDGPLREGQGLFRAWLADAALMRHGFTTRSAAPLLATPWPAGTTRRWTDD